MKDTNSEVQNKISEASTDNINPVLAVRQHKPGLKKVTFNFKAAAKELTHWRIRRMSINRQCHRLETSAVYSNAWTTSSFCVAADKVLVKKYAIGAFQHPCMPTSMNTSTSFASSSVSSLGSLFARSTMPHMRPVCWLYMIWWRIDMASSWKEHRVYWSGQVSFNWQKLFSMAEFMPGWSLMLYNHLHKAWHNHVGLWHNMSYCYILHVSIHRLITGKSNATVHDLHHI